MALAHAMFRLSDWTNELLTMMAVNLKLKKLFKAPPDLRLDGKVIIVTGGNRGIGKVVSTDLASRGAKIIIACRDVESAEVTATEIRTKVPNAIVIVKKLDLASFDSIRAFASDILASEPKIDILINNAGLVTTKKSETVDQMEMMMQVNCFGSLLLTCLLLDRIIASGNGRIVNTSSMAHHQISTFDFEDINWRNKRSFPYFDVYGHSKLGLMLWTRYLGIKLAAQNVKVYAVDPGVSGTDLASSLSRFHQFIFRFFWRSIQESGDSVVSAVLDDSGSYEPGVNYYMVDGRFKNASPFARNDGAAEKLWQLAYHDLALPN